MKVGILAGGYGTRLSEETTLKPKPMVEIGGKPIIWHIMKFYAAYGFKEFVIALGYKGEMIKDFFVHYHFRSRSLTVNLDSGRIAVHNGNGDDWVVHLLDTGLETNTGGRVKQIAEFIGNETFMLTYGDGVCDLNLEALVIFHQDQRKLATVTAVRPPARFGGIVFDGNAVGKFAEKSQIGEGWINGGFFVLEPGIIEYIRDENTLWEGEPLENLVKDGQLAAYRHESFWQCMDTLRDVRLLDNLWMQGAAPWKVWK